VNRVNRPNTWLHRPMLQTFKKVLANSEPSTHGGKADMAIALRRLAASSACAANRKAYRRADAVPENETEGQLRATAFRQQICGTSGDYGSNNADLFRQVGNYTGRILKGENRPTFLLSKPRSLR
jgi:hypothetical protein